MKRDVFFQKTAPKGRIALAFPQINWIQTSRGQKCDYKSPDCPEHRHYT